MVSRLWLFLLCLAGGCTTPGSVDRANELPYHCNDLVVIGRVTTLGGTSITSPAPLPNWQSQWQLQMQINRVIRGSEQRPFVPATGVSHAQIRQDRDFLAVLHPAEGGAYTIETAALWDVQPRPRLAEPCS